MSTVRRTHECYPELTVDAIEMFLGYTPAIPEARHADCSGGQHISGVLGGWHCPCPCHQATERTSP